jgi:CubicO group peptidase (beta-lactamase class C family)
MNDLLSSPDSSFLSEPTKISSGDGEPKVTATVDSLNINEDIDSWFDRSQTKALLVQKDGAIVYQRYSPDADFGRNINGLSMAKNILAMLIGIAIDEGKIKSEYDLISQYIPELDNESAVDINIRDLLRHTSGITSTLRDLRSTMDGKWLERDLSEITFKKDAPFKYDNINYYLLNILLQNLYQKPLSKILEAKIWKPLGLSEASIINTTGYCCLFASANAWLAIGNLYLDNNQKIVSPNWIKKMTEDTVTPEWFFVQATGKSTTNSYGYHVYSGLSVLPEIFWLEGMGLQLILINPENNTIIVRLGGIPSKFSLQSNRHDDSLIEPLLKILQ